MAILALVALISRRIQNFRRTAGLTFSAFHDWSIEQSVSVQTSDYEQNTLEYTYQWNETVFFPENSTDFVFQKLPEEIQSKIVYFCSVIKRIFTPQSRCSLHAILTQMIRFWIPPMMLSDRSALTPCVTTQLSQKLRYGRSRSFTRYVSHAQGSTVGERWNGQ